MALASLDFLPVVKASFASTNLGGLHRLTLQTPRGGMCMPRLFGSDSGASRVGDSAPNPGEFPGSSRMIDALPLREMGGQHAPLDPTFGHLKDRVEYGPHSPCAWSSAAFGGWDEIFDPLPFLVGQVAWIYFFVHTPILHNQRGLFRQPLSLTLSNYAA